MLFLTRGEMPHERLWRRWFGELDSVAFSGCKPDSSAEQFVECGLELELQQSDPIARQHLFSVYMHTDQDFAGYAHDSLFYGAVPTCLSMGAAGVRHAWLSRLAVRVGAGG